VVIENARGGNGSDTLLGTSTANTLSGMAGNDSLNGAGGNDILSGYYGNDTLRGGLGNDRLYGGPNNDYFVFNTKPNSSANFDTIMDYSVPQDQIHLENAIFTRLGSAGPLSSAFFRPYYRALDSNDFIMYESYVWPPIL
jgi:serralysin